jgi:methyltransferase (TIGR00027 family)
MWAAVHRASHQTLEGGSILKDPFACPILGEGSRSLIAQEAADPSRRMMRLFTAARSRFAEDALARSVSRGVRQAVILGAGLDTFALRNPHAPTGLHVFEVDYPATQNWKRARLRNAGIALPASLTFAPVDFERQSLGDGLIAAGFWPDQPAFFQLLGVVLYLTREANAATLDYIARIPESEVVFDYNEQMASIGEPWLSYFNPGELAADLRARGFSEIEDLGLAELGSRYFDLPQDEPDRTAGKHMIRARRIIA